MQSHALQALIDAVAANVAVLDRDGTIIAINRAWRRFADNNGLALPDHGLGANYAGICEAAASIDSARAVGDAIRKILAGESERFELKFSSQDADADRWHRIAVTSAGAPPKRLAVVAHEVIEEAIGSRSILDFEDLTAELSAAFVRARDREIDEQLDYWLERIVLALDLDRAVIGEVNAEDGELYTTHQWSRPGLFQVPIGLNVREALPWTAERLLAGELIVLSREEDLPTKADRDLETGRNFGFKSSVMTPLKAGDSVVGGLACGTLVQRRDWSPRLVQRLQMVAQVFANALERKRARLTVQKLNEELRELSRVTLMGELTASLAHELNQPLGAILNNAQASRRLLRAKKIDLKEVRGAVNAIIRDDMRATEIVRNVRTLFKPALDRMAPADPRRLVGDAERIVRADAKTKGITLHTDFPARLPKVRCHRTQIIQVLMNLLLNAFDAISADGAGPRKVDVSGARADSGHVALSVTDTGPGIAPEAIPRIFDSFFSTRTSGMGMGLAIAKSIVENHGGEICARNNPGCGATVEFTLPVAG